MELSSSNLSTLETFSFSSSKKLLSEGKEKDAADDAEVETKEGGVLLRLVESKEGELRQLLLAKSSSISNLIFESSLYYFSKEIFVNDCECCNTLCGYKEVLQVIWFLF